jgi:hypothetical protein
MQPLETRTLLCALPHDGEPVDDSVIAPGPPAFDHPLSWYRPARTVTLSSAVLARVVREAPAGAESAGFADPVSFSTNAAGLPLLISRASGGGLKVFLDFDGYGSDTPFDTDGQPSTFSASEQAIIYGAWRDIVAFFSMMDVNITTVQPPTGGSNPVFVWQRIVGNLSGGAAYVGAINNNSSMGYNNSGNAIDRHSGIAHEIGHQLNLDHQSNYNNQGGKTNEYSSGYDARHGPIMGVDYAQWVHKWFNGRDTQSANNFQNDLATMASYIAPRVPGSGDDGYMPDDFTGTGIATATPLSLASGSFYAAGSIQRMSDADWFSFASIGQTFNINVEPTFESPLAPKIELYDSTGALVAAKADTAFRAGVDNHSEEFTLHLPAGTYYAKVASHGDYSDLGEYAFFASPLEIGWNTTDVRNTGTGRGGFVTHDPSTGTFYNAGSGADIWNNSDAFRFTYQVLNGDGSITARVTALDNTNVNAKAGLMLRETLAHNSKFAMINFKPSGSQYVYRTSNGGSAASGTASLSIPNWIQLSRTGNLITLRQSSDGGTWSTAGSVTLTSLASQVYIGLATNSHNVEQLALARFTDVSLNGVLGAAAPSFNALPAPTDLTAAAVAAQSTGMTLNWTDVAGETGYAIERSVDGVTFNQVGTTPANVTTFNHDPNFGSMRWWFRVTAIDAGGKSPYSSVAAVVNKPRAPTNQQVVVVSTTQLSLSWRDVSGDTGYRVERSTDGGATYSVLTTTAPNINTYNSTGLTSGLTFTYRITPTSAVGDGVPLVFSGTTALSTVQGFAFTARSANSLAMSWNDISGETSYVLERSLDNSAWSTLASLAANTTSYTDTTVEPLNHYYYRLRGTNGSVFSVAYATLLTATPPATPAALPWVDADIGSPAGAGAGFISGSSATVVGGGTNIAFQSDQFNFLYQPMTGDGQITARLASFDGLNVLAKAAVMIRNTLDATSAFANVVYQPESTDFIYRATAGATHGEVNGPGDNATWLRLVRSGSTFSGHYSASGAAGTWISLGSTTINMNTNVFVGLAVSPRDNAQLAKATFDNIKVTFATAGAPTNVAAVAQGANKVNVTWNDNATGEIGYLLERAADATFTSGLVSIPLPANATSHADTTVLSATTYYYRVTANLSANTSAGPTAAPAVTTPGAATVTTAQLLLDSSPNMLRFTFSQNIGASFSAASLSVATLPSGPTFGATEYVYNPLDGSGTFTLPAGLPDSDYRATLAAGDVLADDFTFDFFILAGDADHDRDVDVNDLGVLASNWQQSPRPFSQGNLDYSANGLVDVADLGILASNWQQELPVPSAPALGKARTPRAASRAIDLLT